MPDWSVGGVLHYIAGLLSSKDPTFQYNGRDSMKSETEMNETEIAVALVH
jgi:hypothetical protein